MQLFELASHGFRNLSPDPVSFGAGITLVTGENAQGKTNLLEAVAILCGQRSFRGATPAEMACGGERFAIEGTVAGRRGSERIAVSWSREDGRAFACSGKAAGFRQISQLAPAVFLAPEHRDLISGTPAVRRRFLDRLVVGMRPAAGDDLLRYAAALRERNALLARWKATRAAGSDDELMAWTEELSVAGGAVRRHRRAALAAWELEFREFAGRAGGDLAEIRVFYAGGPDTPDAIRADCQRLSALERRRGYSLAGPHRDDLSWTRRGRPLAAEASSGEIARTVALARLAEWRSVAAAAGEPPLFGADDFDAGLSEAAAEEFFEALPREAAVLLTTAAAPARWARRATAVVEVRHGSVSPPRALRAVAGVTGVR
ncbi:MAG TPA: AAA family ATPase [Thermoanaerobaculia bacterium]